MRTPAPALVATAPAKENTRERVLLAAERLFAERGVSVSMQEIGKAAGQSNKSVVAYHFGTRADLVLAVLRHHAPDVERRREVMLASLTKSNGLRDWLSCTVRPITEHLESLGQPSWYARFLACTVSDPTLRSVAFDDALTSAPMRTLLEEATRRLPAMPAAVYEARSVMSQHLIVNTCADYERALQQKERTPFTSWSHLAAQTLDALMGLWTAPSR